MRRHTRIALALMCALATPLSAAADAVPSRAAMVDHTPWTDLLSRYVRDGLVDYARLKKNDLPALDAYVRALSVPSREQYEAWSRPDQLAFLLNAYNAFTVKLIVDHYPIDSIRNLTGPDAFKRRVVGIRVAGTTPLSLDALENDLVRPGFAEPRVHFALVCAARSCPALRNEAYVGAKLEQQLDDQAKRFLLDARKNRYDAGTRTLYLSRIFEWFARDFSLHGGTARELVGRYLGPASAHEDVAVTYLDYDWTLNAAP